MVIIPLAVGSSVSADGAEACPTLSRYVEFQSQLDGFVPDHTLVEVFRRALAVAGPDRLPFATDSYFHGWRQTIYEPKDDLDETESRTR